MTEWIHRIIRQYWEPEPSNQVFGHPPERDAVRPIENKIRRRIRRYCDAFLRKSSVRDRQERGLIG